MDRTDSSGIPASPGIVVGPVHLLRWEVPDVPQRIIPDEAIPGEIERLHDALERAQRAPATRCASARSAHAGPEEAAIFDVQLSILDDARADRHASRS